MKTRNGEKTMNKKYKKYENELMTQVFSSMEPKEQDVILKYMIKLSIIHHGAQQIINLVKKQEGSK